MNDIGYYFRWWLVIFSIGLIFLPLSSTIFNKFIDRGYLFSKVLGIGIISYTTFVFSIFRILPFNLLSILLISWVYLIINVWIFKKNKKTKIETSSYKVFIFEEVLFFVGIIAWGFVRAHEPSINGLEKFMDFGFLNSILRSTYLPPTDMWFTPFPINYYYFGHLSTAVLTKISFLPSFVTYNLMIATLFSFCASLSFSLGINLISRENLTRKSIIGGILTALLISIGGNLHPIYSLFKAYNVDNPVPFWNLPLLLSSIPNGYWYPNATRFIPFTIHEFPLYSFVVSDLHGHVLDIINVLLIIAFSLSMFLDTKIKKLKIFLISLFLSIMYMTNAWDSAIYMFLIFSVILVKNLNILSFSKSKSKKAFLFSKTNLSIKNFWSFLESSGRPIATIIILFVVFSLPFNLNFDPSALAHGIGILCAPKFLTDIGRIGPLLFEANHCQSTPFWQLLILYGGFYFFVFSFFVFIWKTKLKKLPEEDVLVLLLIFIATLLIIIPEVIYLKDIYPQHYRANTMFKLVYQSFMMLSICSGYIIVRIMTKTKNVIFYLVTLLILALVFSYPYYAIKSYYGDLNSYHGLDGLTYLKDRYAQDYDAINWINTNIQGRPVIVEAQGDSYTDYARISANTGLPTILGWTVHEWLWRGSYDVPAPRIQEVSDIYQSNNLDLTKNLFKKYNVKYIYVGNLEHQKYPNLIESKFQKIGTIIFDESGTRIYQVKN